MQSDRISSKTDSFYLPTPYEPSRLYRTKRFHQIITFARHVYGRVEVFRIKKRLLVQMSPDVLTWLHHTVYPPVVGRRGGVNQAPTPHFGYAPDPLPPPDCCQGHVYSKLGLPLACNNHYTASTLQKCYFFCKRLWVNVKKIIIALAGNVHEGFPLPFVSLLSDNLVLAI